MDWYDIKFAAGKVTTAGKGIAKKTLIGTGIVVGLAALPFIASNARKSRAYDPNALPPAPEMAQPLPPVLSPMEIGAPQTLMGETPVEGPMAARIRMQREGMAAGVDASNPGLMDVDGKGAPQVLGASR